MTMPMSKASTPTRKTSRERKYECADYFCIAAGADADRHADFDFARPDGADLPVHDDAGADRVGGAEAIHRHREVRDHGDPVLHFGRQLPDPWRRGAAHDQFRVVHGGPLAWR